MEKVKTTMIIGVSENPARVSYTGLKQLLQIGHKVIAVGSKAGFIHNTPVLDTIPDNVEVDTVTLYIRAEIQEKIQKNILNIKMRRLIFNPGTENPVLEAEAKKLGIITENACTLVLLALGQY